MNGVWRNDNGASGTSHPGLTGNRDLKLAINDVPDLIVWMGMLMNPGTGLHAIISEGHVRRMEKAPFSAFSGLLRAESIRVDEGDHNNLTTTRLATA